MFHILCGRGPYGAPAPESKLVAVEGLMAVVCSVGYCSRMAWWHFGEISLCQRHWRDWCRSTWEALVQNLEQPVMVDWIAAVRVREAVEL